MKRAALAAAVCAIAPIACAQTLNALVPRGGQRGSEVELRGYGRGLGDATGLLFERTGIELVELKAEDDTRIVAKVRIAADCALGVHPVWVVTRRGLTRVTRFHVGALREVVERENNDARERAEVVSLPATVNGRLMPGDADWFRLDVVAGQRVCAEVDGVRLDADFDPCLTIFDADGTVVARGDDSPLGRLDPIVAVIAPRDGTLFVELRDAGWAGSNTSFYRLHLGDFPRPTGVLPCIGRPGETLEATWLGATAGAGHGALALPDRRGIHALFPERDGAVAPTPIWVRVRDLPIAGEGSAEPLQNQFAVWGVVAQPGEVDRFAFAAHKGDDLDVIAIARRLRSPLDPVLEIRAPDGKVLAENDDTNHPDSRVRARIPADGEYVLTVRDQLARGGDEFFYCVEVTPRAAHMTMREAVPGKRPEDFGVAVPAGGTAATIVAAADIDTGAGITLSLDDLPSGVVAEVPRFGEGADQVPVLLRAASDAAPAAALVRIGVRAEKEPTERDASLQHVVPTLRVDNDRIYDYAVFDRLPVVVAEPCPFRLVVEPPRVPIVRGSPLVLRASIERDEGFKESVRVALLANPPGVGSGAVNVAAGATEVALQLDAQGNAAARTWPIVAVATANVGGVARTVSSELFELAVAEPWVEARLDRVRVEQGATVAFPVALTRKREFAGEVTAELLGLPRGATAEARAAGPDRDELAFEVRVAADAPPGPHRTLFVRLSVPSESGPIVHQFGGGELRIDRPLPRKVDAAGGDAR